MYFTKNVGVGLLTLFSPTLSVCYFNQNLLYVVFLEPWTIPGLLFAFCRPFGLVYVMSKNVFVEPITRVYLANYQVCIRNIKWICNVLWKFTFDPTHFLKNIWCRKSYGVNIDFLCNFHYFRFSDIISLILGVFLELTCTM